jgi:hypothetical protein
MVSKSQAKINVVIGDRQIDLIQPSDFEEYRTPNCDAGTGHGQKSTRLRQLTALAGIFLAGETAKEMHFLSELPYSRRPYDTGSQGHDGYGLASSRQ